MISLFVFKRVAITKLSEQGASIAFNQNNDANQINQVAEQRIRAPLGEELGEPVVEREEEVREVEFDIEALRLLNVEPTRVGENIPVGRAVRVEREQYGGESYIKLKYLKKAVQVTRETSANIFKRID